MQYITGSGWTVPTAQLIGVHPVPAGDLTKLENRLLGPRWIRPEAIPDPWGPAVAFGYHLHEHDADGYGGRARDLFALYLRGLLSGVLKLDVISFRDSSLPPQQLYLGEVLQDTSPIVRFLDDNNIALAGLDHDRFIVLRDRRGQIVAIHHPECLFFPASVYSNWPDLDNSAEAQLATEIGSRWDHSVDEPFLQWLMGQLCQLQPPNQPSSPWYAAAMILFAGAGGGAPPASPGMVATVGQIPVKLGNQIAAWPLRRLLDPKEGILVAGLDATVIRGLDSRTLELKNEKGQHIKFLSEADFASLELPLLLARKGTPDQELVYVDQLEWENNNWELVTQTGRQLQFHTDVRGRDLHVIVTATRCSVDQIVCSELAGLKYPESQGFVAPDWPVRGSYLHLVKSCNLEGVAGQTASYTVELLGGKQIRLQRPLVTNVDHQIAIWPDFEVRASQPAVGGRDRNWRFYRIYYFPEGGNLADFRLNLYREADPGPGGGGDETNANSITTTDIDYRPRAFEIGQRSDQNARYGIFRMPPTDPKGTFDVDKRTGQLDVALDFGTANTCVSFRIPSNQSTPFTDPLKSHWRVIAGAGMPLHIRDKVRGTFLDNVVEVPSELVLLNDLNVALAGNHMAIPDPVVDTSYQIMKSWLLAGFKWEEADLWPGSPVTALQGLRTAKNIYLREFVRAFAANQAKEIDVLHLRASFPHAFDEKQVTSFHESLEHVAKDLTEQCGIQLKVTGYVSESVSAIVSIMGASDGYDYCLAMDMGGGTVDYAVSPRLQPRVKGPTNEMFFADEGMYVSSLRFAGSAVLQAITSWIRHQRAFDSCPMDLAAQLKLTQWIRRWRTASANVVPGLDEPARQPLLGITDDQAILDGAGSAVHDGLLALVYYGCVMLASRIINDRSELQDGPAPKSIRTTVLLIGNGWSLAGLDSRHVFPQWIVNGDEAERRYISNLIDECWASMRSDSPGQEAFFDAVEFNMVKRSPGKRAASAGMFLAQAYTPQEALDRPWEQMVGVKLKRGSGSVAPTTLIRGKGISLGSGSSFVAPSFDQFWGLPQRLLDRLAGYGTGPQGEASAIMNRDIMTLPNLYAPDQSGQYRINESPLKLLIERALLPTLKKH